MIHFGRYIDQTNHHRTTQIWIHTRTALNTNDTLELLTRFFEMFTQCSIKTIKSLIDCFFFSHSIFSKCVNCSLASPCDRASKLTNNIHYNIYGNTHTHTQIHFGTCRVFGTQCMLKTERNRISIHSMNSFLIHW